MCLQITLGEDLGSGHFYLAENRTFLLCVDRVGQVPNVVLVERLVRDGGSWLFYYGGADKNVDVATAPAR